jgi:arylsulfatase A-like enzyme
VWEGGIRTPGLIRWPDGLKAGQTTSQVALSMDVVPTLLAATGTAAPRGRTLDGVNLLPVLRGEKQPGNRTVFWRYRRGGNTRKAAREGNWKYVNDNGAEELHDLGADPMEKNNLLAGEPAMGERLRRKLAAWEVDVRAPRLAGRTG